MAKISSVTVDIDCNLSVTRDTAEACLKLVELYMNSNEDCFLATERDENGKLKMHLTGGKEDHETD